ncbi:MULTISPECIES: PAS domain-containing sensor histidine kinase [Clostridium]|uniref:PAS domain-containing sensor histidine kinase n=1 Tax=Clostridium TaxID=1485 RepID=UPI000DCF969A|nr:MULTISPECIES: ATP-binding protein [Clostridium]MDB2115626.1 ATP-binding protein [Clostridium paraputrificum]MDU3323974.1 ATP-binding protein [Escherichia coli]MDU3411712.1 ATP-binding protein [Clostridium sp.]
MNNNTMKYNRNFMINNEPINELIDSQNIFDNLTCGVYIKKLDGELVYLNKFVEELLNDSNLYREAERHKEIIEKEDFGVVHYDENIRREITIIKDGKEIQMSVIKNSIKDKEQNIIGIIGMLQLLPVEINIRREIVKMINDNKLDTKHLSNKTDLMRSLNFIASRIQNYIDCEGLSIWLHNYKNDFMERFAKCGNVYDIDSIEYDDINIKYKELYSLKEGLLSKSDKLNLQRKAGIIAVEGNVAVYKIVLKEELIGILCVKFKDNDSFMNFQHDYLKSICSEIALMVNKCKIQRCIVDESEKRVYKEKELEDYVEISTDLIATLDCNGKFIKVNDQWTNILGWSAEEMLGMSFYDLVDQDSINRHHFYKNNLGNNDDLVDFTDRYLAKDNTYKYLILKSKYVQSKKEYIITGKDITQDVDVKNKLEEMKKAIEFESKKNDFFTNISHELKTPINIILGSNQLMELNYKNHNITDEKLKNSINLTKQNSYRLLKLVGNFLDISKMGAGFYEIEPINTNIVSVVENIGQSVEPYMAAKKIQFIFDTETEEEIVACDPDKIERIVLNLLSNAIKYTNENGKIFVNVASKESVVEISVEDTGTGIPKDKVEKVFNRFEQVDPSLVKKREGCGIGLSLTKHLVEMHGGEIWVESQEGKGSKFIFTIPKQLVNNQTDEAMDILDDSTRVDKCRIEFSDIYSIQ